MPSRLLIADPGRVFRRSVRRLLESEDGREIYFHENDVREGAFEQLQEGTPVVFAEESGEEGPQASAVTPYRAPVPDDLRYSAS